MFALNVQRHNSQRHKSNTGLLDQDKEGEAAQLASALQLGQLDHARRLHGFGTDLADELGSSNCICCERR